MARPWTTRWSPLPNQLIQSSVWLGFAETRNAVAVFPLTAFLEDFRAFETLENIALAAKGGRCTETTML